MFGMESGKKGKSKVEEMKFDLEEDLKDPGKMRAMKEQVEERIQQLKAMLREGKDKQVFDQAQTLLHGYLAVQKVMQRSTRKMM